jgi:uncharacterized oligopeptide transporter (OPT) family protein
MAEPTGITETPAVPPPPEAFAEQAAPPPPGAHQPYVSDREHPAELTWRAVLLGAFLGILFGASSLYLLLKVGMTVSASVPIAVLSITLFRAFTRAFGFPRASILENNIVQTTGSAGESIAFGVGVTMPALFLLGYEMDLPRVAIVAVLGGLLGILMMIPLRRAFIVKQHGKLIYPEGTACAEVLIAGETGGTTARMVFVGFGIALVHKFFTMAGKLWSDVPEVLLYKTAPSGARTGMKGAALSGELAPELLGVGYLIGPRIAALMMAGAVVSYFIVGPLIAAFGDKLTAPVAPATSKIAILSDEGIDAPGRGILGAERPGAPAAWWRTASLVGLLGSPGIGPLSATPVLVTRVEDRGLIRNMDPDEIKGNYLRYIGAGAVAAGGIISMMRALPLIFASIVSGLRDLRASRAAGAEATARTERDLSLKVVLFGSLGLVLALMAVPSLGLGFSPQGMLGAVMILLFGFLFVTVSSRLTGEVGSSSNPISGMTIATLLMTCLIFLVLGRTGPAAMLTALMVAAVVCIASSNGGTTSQDLKTGFLVGATPRHQQLSILVGAVTSALVIGLTLLLLNEAGTVYTRQNLPDKPLAVEPNAPEQRVGRPYENEDENRYRVVHVRDGDKVNPDVPKGRYLVDAEGRAVYRTSLPLGRPPEKMDNGADAPKGFSAPQPELFASIIEGILGGKLEWSLVIIGVLIAVAVELAGVSSLPLAVGTYIPLSSTTPIFAGGLLRWLADRRRGRSASETETETSPGVLLSSGYIAGGTLCGLIVAFFAFLPEAFNQSLDLGRFLGAAYTAREALPPKVVSLVLFGVLAAVLLRVGSRRTAGANGREGAPEG